ncbi:hypothetical protein Pcinc_029744 [Petrolisthes cinctipes]|uniref:Uncharacterized protein n=1 Tax=Petrolisthes cinctipes TaxID=88211 RepID=A0AAE1EZH2_PETCI|nr:hypothetical protein Pcinc_029744 [Petrolisthes cinctipes]
MRMVRFYAKKILQPPQHIISQHLHIPTISYNLDNTSFLHIPPISYNLHNTSSLSISTSHQLLITSTTHHLSASPHHTNLLQPLQHIISQHLHITPTSYNLHNTSSLNISTSHI